MAKEKHVVIPLSEYRFLIGMYERVSAVTRLIENQKFATIDDIRTILDIKKENESNDKS